LPFKKLPENRKTANTEKAEGHSTEVVANDKKEDEQGSGSWTRVKHKPELKPRTSALSMMKIKIELPQELDKEITTETSIPSHTDATTTAE